MFINRYFATRPESYFFLILSRAPLICFIVVHDTIASSTVFYYVAYRMLPIFIRTKQRFLSVSRVSWMAHRVIIYCRAELRRRSRYGNARRQTENGIYARNCGRRMARVIRRIDRLVFVPERNLSTSSFASPSSSWSLGERERQSIPGEAGDGEAGEEESLHSATRDEKARGRKDGRGVVGWRLIFCSLASASSSASGRPHFARAAQLRVERDHPSSCPPFRSRPTLLLLLFIFLPFAPHVGRFRSLAFAASTIFENARDNDVVSVATRKKIVYLFK